MGFISKKKYSKMDKSNSQYWQSKEEKTQDLINWYRKSTWKNSVSIHGKNSQQTRNRRALLQPGRL